MGKFCTSIVRLLHDARNSNSNSNSNNNNKDNQNDNGNGGSEHQHRYTRMYLVKKGRDAPPPTSLTAPSSPSSAPTKQTNTKYSSAPRGSIVPKTTEPRETKHTQPAHREKSCRKINKKLVQRGNRCQVFATALFAEAFWNKQGPVTSWGRLLCVEAGWKSLLFDVRLHAPMYVLRPLSCCRL